jgi:hypothetical protein
MARSEHHGRTGLAEGKSRSGTNAAACTSDDCNLSGELLH